jgi:hypothetical protein
MAAMMLMQRRYCNQLRGAPLAAAAAVGGPASRPGIAALADGASAWNDHVQ